MFGTIAAKNESEYDRSDGPIGKQPINLQDMQVFVTIVTIETIVVIYS